MYNNENVSKNNDNKNRGWYQYNSISFRLEIKITNRFGQETISCFGRSVT